ncbi:hypothetical protein C8R42DRAFT_778715 [Lentinula raphanica]|nr:hypothetical protein C8R42DRAFT_778715 [Lentinula raphanica]
MDLSDAQTFYDYAHSLPDTYSSSDSSEGDVNDSSSDAGSDVSDVSDVSDGSSDYNSYNSNSNNQPSDYSDSNNSGPPTNVSSDSEDSESDSRPILGSDGRLLPEERERRWRMALCFYCGGDHFRANCPRLWGQTTDSLDEESSEQSDDEGSDGDVGNDSDWY